MIPPHIIQHSFKRPSLFLRGGRERESDIILPFQFYIYFIQIDTANRFHHDIHTMIWMWYDRTEGALPVVRTKRPALYAPLYIDQLVMVSHVALPLSPQIVDPWQWRFAPRALQYATCRSTVRSSFCTSIINREGEWREGVTSVTRFRIPVIYH